MKAVSCQKLSREAREDGEGILIFLFANLAAFARNKSFRK
jgi:hypothetical protein